MNRAIEAMCRAHHQSAAPDEPPFACRWDAVSDNGKRRAAFWMTDAALALVDWIEAAGHEPGQVPGPAVAKRIREVIGALGTE